jgi:hypothetical protein
MKNFNSLSVLVLASGLVSAGESHFLLKKRVLVPINNEVQLRLSGVQSRTWVIAARVDPAKPGFFVVGSRQLHSPEVVLADHSRVETRAGTILVDGSGGEDVAVFLSLPASAR